MKIIFLDIDGVLNHEQFYHERHQNLKKGLIDREDFRDEYGEYFCPFALSNLERLIHKTGAKIVVSSTWRLSGLEVMKELWKKRGLPGEVIGVTPHLSWREQSRSVPRGLEIEHWLQDQFAGFHYYQYTSPQIEIWRNSCPLKAHVILDDDSDMMYYQRNHFVKTSRKSGFNKQCLKKALAILTKAPVAQPS